MRYLNYEKQRENFQKHMRDRNAEVYREFFQGKSSNNRDRNSNANNRGRGDRDDERGRILYFPTRTAGNDTHAENTAKSKESSQTSGSTT